ncbi:MAG TPA: hypothetical protein P5509_06975 [Bacteroidales bacterium]|nr:hypothetical protein [Bacteroidales bacterium]
MKRKRKYLLIFIGILVLLIGKTIIIPRSDSKMRRIATRQVRNYVGNDFLETMEGPVIDKSNKEYVSFKWYTVYDWKDTGFISVDVDKRLNTISRNEGFYTPSMSMNYRFSYSIGKFTDFNNILIALSYEYCNHRSKRLILDINTENYILKINEKKIIFLLKVGSKNSFFSI